MISLVRAGCLGNPHGPEQFLYKEASETYFYSLENSRTHPCVKMAARIFGLFKSSTKYRFIFQYAWKVIQCRFMAEDCMMNRAAYRPWVISSGLVTGTSMGAELRERPERLAQR